jgi:hypothetical protein
MTDVADSVDGRFLRVWKAVAFGELRAERALAPRQTQSFGSELDRWGEVRGLRPSLLDSHSGQTSPRGSRDASPPGGGWVGHSWSTSAKLVVHSRSTSWQQRIGASADGAGFSFGTSVSEKRLSDGRVGWKGVSPKLGS